MITKHPFIMIPGTWLGEGKIQLNMVEEELGFFTRWTVSDKDSSGNIQCVQEIQVKGLSDVMINEFIFSDVSPKNFAVQLENQALGKVTGSGLVDEQTIAWEFRVNDLGFEGFEFYEKQKDGSYAMRAEYATADQFRTLIKGKVWKQEEPKKKS
jgi:hypothetical protein